MFPLVSVQVWYKEPGNYTHLILSPRNYSLIARSSTSSNFEVRNIAFHLLVVSTVSTYISASSTLDFFFGFPFATSDKMKKLSLLCVYIMPDKKKFKIQYNDMCLTSHPLSITLDILFC